MRRSGTLWGPVPIFSMVDLLQDGLIKSASRLPSKGIVMNTKKFSQALSAALVTATSLVVVAPAADAALPKCNSARKGQIVGTQVCSVKKGVYRWVKVVAPPATKPAASSANSGAVAASAVPAGWVRYASPSGKWSIPAPADWTLSKSRPDGTAILLLAKDPSYSLAIREGLAWANKPEDHLATELERLRTSGAGPYTIENNRVYSAPGPRPATVFDYWATATPDFKYRKVNVFLDDKGNTIEVKIDWRTNRPETNEMLSILNIMLDNTGIDGGGSLTANSPAPAPKAAPAPAPAASPAPSAIPADWVKYTSASGKWALRAPASWTLDRVGTAGTAITVSAKDSSFRVFILDALASADAPADHLATTIADKRGSGVPLAFENEKLSSLNGRPTTSFDYYSTENPTFKSRQINVFLDGNRNTVRIDLDWREGRPETAETKAILSTILSSVEILP
jgi:hypothetical protein